MKTVALRKAEDGGSYELMKISLEAPAERGLGIAQIRMRLKVLDKLDAAKDAAELVLEDAEYATLREAFDGVRWNAVKPIIVDVSDDIANAF